MNVAIFSQKETMSNPFEAESNPYATPTQDSVAHGLPPTGRTYGGIGRLAYFGYSFLANIFFQMVFLGITALVGVVGGEGAMAVVGLLLWGLGFLGCMGVFLYIVAQRLINIGSSPLWCIGMLIPLVNFYVGIRCLVCPEGYDDHRTLDGPAKIIIGLMIAFFLLMIVGIVLLLGVPV